MTVVRKFIAVLLLLILKTGLLLLPILFAVVIMFGSPDKIKNSLEQSGIYDIAVNSVFDSFTNRAKENEELSDSLPLDDPEIRNIVNSVVTPEFIRESVNSSVDSIYVWLNGKSTVPELSIDLTQSKQTLIQKIADYAVERVEKLPECTMKENLALDEQNIDPFSLACRPPIDLNATKQQFIEEINKNEELSKNLVISADSKESRELFQEQLRPVQRVFQLSKSIPVVLTLICALLAVAIIFISDTKTKGLKRVSVSLVLIGSLLIVSSLLGIYFFGHALGVSNSPEGVISSYINIYDPALREAVFKITKSIFYDFNRIILIVSGVYVLVGAGTLIWLKLRTRHTPKEITKSTPEANSPTENNTQPTPDNTNKDSSNPQKH